MTLVADLEAALLAEFSDVEPKVVFAASVPARFSPPQVVVTPGDPFLEPSKFADQVRERWSVLVVVSMADRASGLEMMRSVSLRVRRAVSPLGARWLDASGPQIPEGSTSTQLVLSDNTVEFTYSTTEQTPT